MVKSETDIYLTANEKANAFLQSSSIGQICRLSVEATQDSAAS